MAAEVLVPQMGESVLEGTILEWKVKVGDKIELNQPLVELMTDKVNIEIPSEVSGTIKEILVKEGDVVPVGARIAIIDDGSSTQISSEPTKESQSAQRSADARASAAASSAPATPAPAPAPTAVAEAPRNTAPIGKGKMSPKVRMMMREYSLDPTIVTPTGKEGLVTVDDVLRAVENRSQTKGFTAGPIPAPAPPPPVNGGQAAAAPSAPSQPAKPLVEVNIPVFQQLPPEQRETRKPVEGVRKLIADHMVKSKQTSPHVTTFEDIDFTDLVEYRNSIKADFKATYGANITFMPYIIKAATTALKEFPKINASMTDKEIIYKNFFNVGIAVAREDGLIVPVIKDADKKTIVELAVEINQLGNKARTNKLKPTDVEGGTFTVTNAGMFGATASTPIINQPQVAILGVHAIVKKPWVVDGEIKIRDISTFGMSFDHRLIDGHTAVQFLHRVHEYIANTRKLLLQLR